MFNHFNILTMSFGTKEDMSQEGLFDKTEELTLNYEQVAALLIAVAAQHKRCIQTVEYLQSIKPEETVKLKLTREEIEDELLVQGNLNNILPYLHKQLLEIADMLEPDEPNKIVNPG